MSTRRARIKAIATLPQRRKNVDTVKKELVETNDIKSPKASQGPSADEVVKTSPVTVNNSSPRRSPRVVRGTPEPDKGVPGKLSNPGPVLEKQNTVQKPEVFLSPRALPSPLRLRSPVTRTPVIEVDVGAERILTPHKRLIELQDEAKKLPEKENVESQKKDILRRATADKKNIDGYNSPNTPEPDVMDGIVPLKPVSKAPKPIDLLKSEIISENAEVVFDPIVPLPSPTKMRPKLRPVPRLGPIGPVRRNSIPGSASESEDESRRQHGPSTPIPARLRHDSQSSHSTLQSLPNRDVTRVRNDSACSMISQGAPQTPALLGSPLKEKSVSKVRRQEVSRRMAALRRRKESIQRDKLTMYDLIFYNPLSNPIVKDQEEENDSKSLSNKKEEVDNVKAEESKPSNNAAPVPQIKLGPNGEIVLDEQSLVIKQSERELSKSVVRDNEWTASGRVYRKTPRTADWTDAETVRFYRAIAAMGTDFTLMESLFPGRTRRDLKLKFKKEEKMNMAQIDKALRSVSGWDMNRLLKEFTEERKQAEEQAIKEKERLKLAKEAEKERIKTVKELNVRQSRGSKALGESILPLSNASTNKHCITADDVINQALARKQKRNMLKNKHDYATLTKIKTKPAKVAIPRLTPPIPKPIVSLSRLTPTFPKPMQDSISRLTPPMPIHEVSRSRLTPTMPKPMHDSISRLTPTMPKPLQDSISRLTPTMLKHEVSLSRLTPTMPKPIQDFNSRLTPTIPKPILSLSRPTPKPIQPQSPVVINALPVVPENIAPGSLVVLTVDDPKAPTKKAIHTYIKQGDGSIQSIVLDSSVMSSLVTFVRKDTPKPSGSSPSPGVSRNSPISPCPKKRKRLTSYDLTNL